MSKPLPVCLAAGGNRVTALNGFRDVSMSPRRGFVHWGSRLQSRWIAAFLVDALKKQIPAAYVLATMVSDERPICDFVFCLPDASNHALPVA